MGCDDWISDACHLFTDATGWRMRFDEPGNTGPSAHILGADLSRACWRTELTAGGRHYGRLSLLRPTRSLADSRLLSVCDMADVLAATLRHVLEGDAAAECESRGTTRPDFQANSTPSDRCGTIENILSDLIHRTKFHAAALFVKDPETSLFRLHASCGIDAAHVPLHSRDITGTGPDAQALRVGPISVHHRDTVDNNLLPTGMTTAYCQSVRVDEHVLGTLWVFGDRHESHSLRDLHSLKLAAIRLATQLERDVLWEEHALQNQIRAELRIASEAHTTAEVRHSPRDGWCTLAGRSQSHGPVGGDLCEVLPLGEERILVAIGDAAGHSIPAAMVMATVRGALRILIEATPPAALEPAVVLQHINHVLYSILQSHQFMTLICGLVDRRGPTFSFASAGHPAPLLVQKGRVRPLECHGLLLGVTPHATYQTSTVSLNPTDLVVLYTDGVTEASNRDRRMFGKDGLLRGLDECREQSLAGVVDSLWLELDAHLGGQKPADDRTLLALRIASQVNTFIAALV